MKIMNHELHKIFEMKEKGYINREIADKFNVSVSLISKIVNNRRRQSWVNKIRKENN